MELRTLRYFVAIATAGSVSAAAKAVHVTQPALSRQVRQLEHELGVDLFIRERGRMTLSAAGQQFLSSAKNVLYEADQARQEAASLASGQLRQLSIAAPRTTLNDVVVPFLARWTPADPFPSVVESAGHTSIESLGAEIDLVILTERPQPGVSYLDIAALPLWAYVRVEDPLSGRDSMEVAELAGRDILSLPQIYKPRQLLDAALDTADVALGSLIECSTAPLAQALAAAGQGVAVVTDDPKFGLHPIALFLRGEPIHIRLFAAWDRRHHGASTLSAIAERLRDFVEDRYRDIVSE